MALAFTRQKLPVLPGTAELAADGVARGGYVLAEAEADEGGSPSPTSSCIATGSELAPGRGRARRRSTAEGIRTRVVSMPCWERFAAQPAAYRDEVLPPDRAPRA